MTNLQWKKLPQGVDLLKGGGRYLAEFHLNDFFFRHTLALAYPVLLKRTLQRFFILHRRTLYIIVTYPALYCDSSLKNTEHYCGRPWMKCFAWTSFLHHRGAAKPGAVKFRRTYMDHITLYHPGVMLATPLSSFYYHYCITLVICAGQPSLEQ